MHNKNQISKITNRIKFFFNSNKVLSICFVISLIYLFLYLGCFEESNNCLSTSKLINVIFQISIGYIINFIFYITQVYIPQRKIKESVNNCIKSNINKIINEANDMFSHLSYNLINKDVIDFNDDDFLTILQNLNVNGEVNVINPSKLYDTVHISDAHYIAKEWIRIKVQSINTIIDETLNYYANYVTPELLDVFNRIKNSSLNMNMVNSLLYVYSISFNKIQEDMFFAPYYKMINELRGYIKQFD